MSKFNLIKISLLILFLSFNATEVKPARILAISGLPQAAKYAMMATLLNALNDRGHDITFVIRFSHQAQLNENIRQILITENEETFKEFLKFSSEVLDSNFFPNLQNILYKGVYITSNIIYNPEVGHIMQHEHFDLILFDTFLTEALYGLGEHFNAPMVGVSSFGSVTTLDKLVGNSSPTSYIPPLFMHHIFEVDFWQRCLNVALTLVDKITYDYMYLPPQRQLYKELFPNASLTFDQAQRNFSLVLLNQHFSLNLPRPYVPNMIEVAGIHIEDPYEKLSLNLQQFLDNSPQVVIYFHLGIGITSSKLNSERALIFLNTFKTLNYNIVWHMDYIPAEAKDCPNILHVHNVSHYALLDHPNVKLFIASGDALNLIDAVYFVKPILSIPMFPHHRFNVNMAIKMGYSLGLKLTNLNELKLKQTILELLNNRRYLETIRELSVIFRDQPLKPKEKAVYWIEYVLRHKGAMHLRNKGRFLNMWQFFNVDVYLAYLTTFIVIVFIIWISMKSLFNLLHRSKRNLQIKVKKS